MTKKKISAKRPVPNHKVKAVKRSFTLIHHRISDTYTSEIDFEPVRLNIISRPVEW